MNLIECFYVLREGSPRDTIMESLAGNLDGSEVSWSSALATPTNPLRGHTLDCTTPSTLERQTLHPRQGLRENVSCLLSYSVQKRHVIYRCDTFDIQIYTVEISAKVF